MSLRYAPAESSNGQKSRRHSRRPSGGGDVILDIFQACSLGDTRYVQQFLGNVENDVNEGDDHGFTPLHWACRDNNPSIAQLLVARGGRINARNDGGDTPLHLACSQGHADTVAFLLKCKANINILNEHGNSPLHYACFFNKRAIADELVARGALVMQCNRYNETPVERASKQLKHQLVSKAEDLGQPMQRIEFEQRRGRNFSYDSSILKSIPSTTSIQIGDVQRSSKISDSVGAELYKGVWNGIPVAVKMLKVPFSRSKRLTLLLNEEYPRLRIFSHPNVLPVITAVAARPQPMLLAQYMQNGSLYDLLHGTYYRGIQVDRMQTVKFASDIAAGMAYLHSLTPAVKRFSLTPYHIMIEDDFTARISMQDVRFSFQDDTKVYRTNWMSPQDLREAPATVDREAADMWSYAIILWELATRQVPYSELSAMQCGMKIATEDCRPPPQPGMSQYLTKLMALCWNSIPNKRPRFNQIVPILEKMER